MADVPVDGRRAVIQVRVRRLVCPTLGCRHTYREQVPGVLQRYQRRTVRLTRQVKAVVKKLAGRAGARVLAALAVGLSRHTALRTLLNIPLPAGRAPRVIGVDDFALRRRHRYATVVIDADRSHISPRRLARMLLTRPGNLKAEHHDLLARLTAVCPEMTHLTTTSVRDFANLLTPCAGNADRLPRWIVQVRTADLPHLHAFTRGLTWDRDAVIAALTLPYSNGPTEDVNTKTKRIARQCTDEQ